MPDRVRCERIIDLIRCGVKGGAEGFDMAAKTGRSRTNSAAERLQQPAGVRQDQTSSQIIG
jgi:hypothetical protein